MSKKIHLHNIPNNATVIIVLSTRGNSYDHKITGKDSLIKALHPDAIDLNDTDFYIESHHGNTGDFYQTKPYYWELCSRSQGRRVDSSTSSARMGGFIYSIELAVYERILRANPLYVGEVKVLNTLWDYKNNVLIVDEMRKNPENNLD